MGMRERGKESEGKGRREGGREERYALTSLEEERERVGRGGKKKEKWK